MWTPDGSGNYHADATQTLTGHPRYVYALALDQETKTLFSGSADNTVKVWTPDGSGNYHAVETLSGHSAPVYALTYDQDPKTLFSGSTDRSIKVWTVIK